MDHQLDSFHSQQNPDHRIGIIYAYSPESSNGREIEKAADCETAFIALEIQRCLQSQGYLAETVELNPAALDDLSRFNWIFNLAETINKFPLFDYQVASELEHRNINFTGSGSATLKACRDKAYTKNELSHTGMLTPAYEVFPIDSAICTRLTFPLFVKPLYEDGSFGIKKDSRVGCMQELIRKVEQVHANYQQPALVEEFIQGRDVTASVLGNGEDAVVLPLSEITYTSQEVPNFMTFQAKWIPESLEYQSTHNCCPANIDPALADVVREFALRACRIMNCRDYARVDFRLKGNIPYLLEVNPNPCINPEDSGFVRAGKAYGYNYNDLITAILHHSMARLDISRNHPSLGVRDVNQSSSSSS